MFSYAIKSSTGIPGFVATEALAYGGGSVYKWNNTNGFGPKYSEPVTSGSSQQGAAFSPTSNALVMGGANSKLRAWQWSSSGYGTQYTDSSTIQSIASIYDIAFSPDGNYVFCCGQSGAYIAAYPWSYSTGFGTKYTNVTPTVGQQISKIAINPTSNAVVFAGYQSTSIGGYKFSSSGFGTKYSDPASLPAKDAWGIGFLDNGATVVAATEGTPGVHAWQFTQASGFGTKYANPSTSFTNGYSLAVNPAGTVVACGMVSSPYVAAYAWSGGFGTKYSDPSSAITDYVRDLTFSSDGSVIAFAINSSPYIEVYAWSNGFGSKYSNPSVTPSSLTQSSIVFSGKY